MAGEEEAEEEAMKISRVPELRFGMIVPDPLYCCSNLSATD